MKILWLTWRDRSNQCSGGAEIVNEELATRLVQAGHEIIFLVAGFPGGPAKEEKNGYQIIRLGNRWTVYWQAYRYYKTELADWPDLVIDEANVLPFFAKYYVKQKNIIFSHEACRIIWFYQMFFPLNIIGYLLEPLYLWLLNDRQVVTVSADTKNTLVRYGFKAENVHIITQGINLMPMEQFTVEKFDQPTILSFGSIRERKRTKDIIRAFELAKQKLPNLELVIAGAAAAKYADKVFRLMKNSPYSSSIHYHGFVTQDEKASLMRKAHILCSAAANEGWGLVVTEAGSQGTPTVAYNVNGYRCSIKDGVTGRLCHKNNPRELAKNILALTSDDLERNKLAKAAWQWSKELNFDRACADFLDKLKVFEI